MSTHTDSIVTSQEDREHLVDAYINVAAHRPGEVCLFLEDYLNKLSLKNLCLSLNNFEFKTGFLKGAPAPSKRATRHLLGGHEQKLMGPQ